MKKFLEGKNLFRYYPEAMLAIDVIFQQDLCSSATFQVGNNILVGTIS